MKPKPRLYTVFDVPDYPQEISELPSLTEPNMALTPAEIIERFTQGRPVPASNNMEYTGDELFPNLAAMDLTEVEAFHEANTARIAALSAELKEAKKRKKAALREIEQRSEDRSDSTPPPAGSDLTGA